MRGMNVNLLYLLCSVFFDSHIRMIKLAAAIPNSDRWQTNWIKFCYWMCMLRLKQFARRHSA